MGIMDKFMNLLGINDELEEEAVEEKEDLAEDWAERNRRTGG
jgi:hypothetical protein